MTCRVETRRIELPTSWLQTSESPAVSGISKEVTSSPSARCTGEADSANEQTADPLANSVASLTDKQRQRLAALLTGKREGGEDV
jgi:hypothetical protein